MYIVKPLRDRFMTITGIRFLTAGEIYLTVGSSDRFKGIVLIDDNGENHHLGFEFLNEEEYCEYQALPQEEKDMLKMLYPKELRNEC